MSLTMYGGPADDQSFACVRAPALLRVVRGPHGRWDVLDQLDDEPHVDEAIYLYEQTHNQGGAFICPGGWTVSATYRHIINVRRDLDPIVRDTRSWRRFVEAYFGVTLGPGGERVADVVAFPKRGKAIEQPQRGGRKCAH